jgi:hypothetical protein
LTERLKNKKSEKRAEKQKRLEENLETFRDARLRRVPARLNSN